MASSSRPLRVLKQTAFWLFMAVLLGGAFMLAMLISMEGDDRQRFVAQFFTSEEQAVEANLSGHYLAGQYAMKEHRFSEAATYLEMALKADADNIELKRNALRVLIAADRIDEAGALADTMAMAEIHDPLVVMARLSVAMKRGEYKTARAVMDSPGNGGMFALIKPLLTGWADTGLAYAEKLASKPVTEEHIPIRDDFLAPFLNYQRALMNDMLGHTQEAAKAYDSVMAAIDATPYRVVQGMANFYLRQGQPEKAETLYADYAKTHPDSKLIPSEIPGIDLPPDQIQPMVQTPADGLAEIYFTAASLLFGEHMNRETLLYIRLALYMRADFPPAQMMLANLLEQYNDHLAAIAIYKQIDKQSVFYRRGQYRMALNYRAAELDDRATELLKQFIKDYPDETEPALLLGEIYRHNKEYRRAIDAYSHAVALEPTPTDWELYYKRGIAYERDGQWDRAEADFMQALALNEGQPDVLNYLGYSWLEQGKNLEEAMAAIQKAYEQSPGEAHITDSLGWAYYKIGMYKQAVVYLEEAIELAPQDATINDHLGDAYWRVGRKIEARFQWRRALSFQPDDEDAIQAKLENGLPEAPSDALADKQPAHERTTDDLSTDDPSTDNVAETP